MRKNNIQFKINNRNYTAGKAASKGMAGEKILSVIGWYLTADTLIMAIGLLHKSGPMRGYPYPWLGPHGSGDPAAFVISLIINTIIITVGYIITSLAIRAGEPVTEVQKTLDRYSTPYTEYEDPYPAARSSSAASPVRTYPSSGNKRSVKSYEKALISDYEKIKDKLSNSLSWAEDSGSSEVTEPAAAGVNRINKKKSSGTVVSILIIVLAVILTLATLIDSVTDDSDSDYEDSFGENIVADEDEYGYSASLLEMMGYDAIDGIRMQNPEQLGELDMNDLEPVFEMFNWNISDYDLRFDGTVDDDTAGICRYLFTDDEDNYYLVALLFEGEMLNDDDGYGSITGIAVQPLPDYEDEIDDMYDYADPEYAVTAGKKELEGESILTWGLF